MPRSIAPIPQRKDAFARAEAVVTDMDNKMMNQPKKRWTVMDTVVLLLVLAALAGIVARVVYTARREAEETPVIYYVDFEVMEIHKDVLAEVKGFDAIYLYENDVRLGYMGVYQDGVVALAITPVAGAADSNLVTAKGTLVCNNAIPAPNGGIQAGSSGRYMTPGSVLEVRTDRAVMTIRVTAVRERG